jgi:hypothetical protein
MTVTDETLVIDIDSTHFDTFGEQEFSDFNAHYQTYGFHPLVAFDANTGLFLGAELRSGNTYTSTGVAEFLEPILHHFMVELGFSAVLVRGDSGFATPELYELCEEYGAKYVIRLKNNQILKKIGIELQFANPNVDITKSEEQYFLFDYQAKSWSHSRKVVALQERRAGELIFDNMYVVTNLNLENIPPKNIIEIYKKRGNMENFIKEAKNGFFMDKTDSSKFYANACRMMLSMLAYNIIAMMRLKVLTGEMKTWTISTLREHLIKVAGRVSVHAREIRIKLDETFVHMEKYFQIAKAVLNFSI